MVTARKKNVDATYGPMFMKMFYFTIPLMLANVMNHLYNMADNIVVGKFSGDPLALASVGATASLVAMFTNFAIGLSSGAGVVVARNIGARDKDGIHKSVHTSIALSLVIGIIMAVLQLFISEPILVLMGTKSELIDGAVCYAKIMASGMPGTVIYAVTAATLRSTGDSKTPLFAVMSTGILNVLLNLFFVVVCGMTIDGVALATVISKYASAVIVLYVLAKNKKEVYALSFKAVKIDGETAKNILYIGIPSAFQNVLFSVTNLLLTSALNTFPTEVMSARTIATNIDVLLSTAINTYMHTALIFTGQNYGAKKPDRIKKSILYATIQAATIGLVVGQIMLAFNEPLINLYLASDDPYRQEVIMHSKTIMTVMLSSYFIGAVVEALTGFLRGLGASIVSMVASILGVCVFRSLWITLVFPQFRTVSSLYTVYPTSYIFTGALLAILSIIVYKKSIKKLVLTENDQQTE